MIDSKEKDNLYLRWIECADYFRKCREQFDAFLDVDNWEFTRSSQIEAGKLFFETGRRIKYPCEFDPDYFIIPEPNYAEYWLCVLDVFTQNCASLIECQFLPRYSLPYDNDELSWSLLSQDDDIKKQFDLEPPITDLIINASIVVCDLIANLRGQQLFHFNEETRTISHGGYRIDSVRDQVWDFISVLFDNNSAIVGYDIMCEKLWFVSFEKYQQEHVELKAKLQKTVNDVRSYLKDKKLNAVAKAIINSSGEGYLLDQSLL